MDWESSYKSQAYDAGIWYENFKYEAGILVISAESK